MKFTIPNEKTKIMRSEKILIAEFMGLIPMSGVEEFYTTRVGSLGINQGGFLHEMKYDTSWDWLMPVVEKIESLFDSGIEVIIKGNRCHLEFNTQLGMTSKYENLELPEFYSGFCKSKTEAVYKAVVEFIKWHNKQAK